MARPLGLLLVAGRGRIDGVGIVALNPHTGLVRHLGWTLLLAAMLMLAPVSWSIYVMLVPPLHVGLLVARRVLSLGWRLLLPLGILADPWCSGDMPCGCRICPSMALTSTALAGVALWWVAVVKIAADRAAVDAVAGVDGQNRSPGWSDSG